MKILFLGDSITAGVGASLPHTKYVEIVKASLNCVARNYGISGSRIARQRLGDNVATSDWDFQQRAIVMDKIADYVFVFGGTNDLGHGNAEFGEKGSTDPYTFWGAMENLTEYLIDTYGKEKLCFLLPLHRAEENKANGATLCDYVNVMKELLTEKEIDFLDFYNNGPEKPLSKEPNEFFLDGLHPNENGHLWIAEQVINYIKTR